MQFEIKTCAFGGSGSLLEDFGLARRRVSEKQGCENLFGRL